MADRSITVRLGANVQGFMTGMRTAEQAARDFGRRAEGYVERHGASMEATGRTAMLMGGTIVAGVGLAIAKYAEFDQAMSEVKASTHETTGNMDLLREAAIVAGADTAFSAKEAAQGIDELAKAGVSTKDVLAGGLTGALSLAAAGSLGVGEAAEIAATALTQFKLSGQDIPHVADLLAAGAGKAQGSVSDMGAALKQAGLVASSTGLSIEETTGGLAAFASAGLVGSDAGTSFKSMLQRLTPQSKEAQKQMDALGLSAYDSQGEFIGLAAYSGKLQNSMKDLDSESRNAAMGVMFGSDAVRAANVLYEQGATGVQGWIDAVNETGFAAQTAAIKQDNLAGDLEKLGGSFDTVLIKGGEGAAQSLRGVVQSAEDLVDMMGKIPKPVMDTGMAMAATVGGVALLAGGFLKMVPALVGTVQNFRGVFREGSRIPGVMGRVGKGVGIATAALLAFEIFNAVAYQKRIIGLEEMTSALLKVANAADGSATGLDAVFSDFGKFAGKDIAPDVNSVADAIERITNPESADGIDRWADAAFGWTGLAKSETTQVDDRLKQVGDSMGALAKNGGMDAAAKSFNALSEEFVKNGSDAQDALDHLPGYEEALRGIGNAAGLSLDPFELLELAAGKIPARLAKVQAAQEQTAASTEEAAKQSEVLSAELEDLGVSAQGAITNLDDFTKSLVSAGLLTLSSRDAARGYQETLDSFSETLAKNGQNLDINTAAGRENEAAIDAIAKAGIASAQTIAQDTEAYASNTEAQAAVQEALKNTYTDMVNAYMAMGKGKDEAIALTRETLKVPKDVKIETWMADAARAEAEKTKAALDNIPRRVEIDYVNTTTNRVINMAAENHIAEGPGGRGGLTQGGYTGGLVGSLAGLAGGGKVPGVAPRNSHGDNVLAMINGKPFGLRSEEWVINEPQSKKNDHWLKAINDGLDIDDMLGARGFAAPAKATGSGYSAPMTRVANTGSAGSSSGSGGGDINLGGITIYGATDAAAVARAVEDKITYKFQKAGVRI
ncbi:phage tail tape measure protein [Specibacter sp. NPDC078692]|uniref:phage tail tape measure protein n=1 Tax=Specibacter sp. NPDC078692 TaxID=3155818 RepID=UPI0034146D90